MKLHFQKRWLVMAFLSLVLALPLSQSFAQAQYAVPVVVVNTSFLNVRTGPGVQYSTLATFVGGTELPVLGVGTDGVWYLVSTPVGVGWVNVEFTLPRGNFSVVPTINVNSLSALLVAPIAPVTIGLNDLGQGGGAVPSMNTSERFRGRINVLTVNLRNAPADNAPALTIMREDETGVIDFAIVGRSVDSSGVEWLAIDVPDFGVGWVEAPKLELRLSARYRTVLQVVSDSIGLTSGPGGGDSIGLPILQRNQEAFLLSISRDSLFVQVELGDGVTGWVPFSAIQTRTGTTSDILAEQMGTQASQPASVTPSAPITFVALDMPHLVINTSFLNVRSGPGGEFTSIATVSGGTELNVLGITEDAFWYLVRGSFGQGWVDSDFVLFRGSISNVPVISSSAAVSVAVTNVPVAIFSSALTLYAAPGVNFGSIGVVNGPSELPIVARTADGTWVQLNTTAGFGWVLSSQVVLRGDLSLIPVVG
jgi:uncharacterized protein YraI